LIGWRNGNISSNPFAKVDELMTLSEWQSLW
jgi:hypothetical protein